MSITILYNPHVIRTNYWNHLWLSLAAELAKQSELHVLENLLETDVYANSLRTGKSITSSHASTFGTVECILPTAQQLYK